MARPLVVSGKGLEGIDARASEQLLVADEADEFAGRVAEILDDDMAAMGAAGREFVCAANSWDASLAKFSGFLQ